MTIIFVSFQICHSEQPKGRKKQVLPKRVEVIGEILRRYAPQKDNAVMFMKNRVVKSKETGCRVQVQTG